MTRTHFVMVPATNKHSVCIKIFRRFPRDGPKGGRSPKDDCTYERNSFNIYLLLIVVAVQRTPNISCPWLLNVIKNKSKQLILTR